MPTLPPDFWQNEARYLKEALGNALIRAALSGVAGTKSKVGISFDPNLANMNASQWAKAYTDSLLIQLQTTDKRVVGDLVSRFVETKGYTMKDIVEALKAVPEFSEYRADLIAVTEITRAYSSGNEVSFRASGITQWRWNTNRDELVCPVCGPLNGKVVMIGTPFGVFGKRKTPFDKPPAYPGCRCWVTPFVPRKTRRATDRREIDITEAANARIP